jgi:BirA family biotin operon repressor/biotin-[acetyl-CoA-carboxylase] ligase
MPLSSPSSSPAALAPALARCTPERIASLCGPAAHDVLIEVVNQTGSTNADLLGRLDSLAPRQLLLAHSQTAGRGRAGRSWLSAADSSLTFSLAWKFRRRLPELVGLPLAVGVAIAQAMAYFQVPVQLKWPNDILRNGKKLAGVLIESSAAKPDGAWAVIGIGLNINVPERLAAQIGQPAAYMSSQPMARDVLMAALLDELAVAMNLFEDQGFAAFEARWNALHAHRGQPVAIMEQGSVLQEGIAVGVDQIGRLLLDIVAGSRVAVMAGDVSLRARGTP